MSATPQYLTVQELLSAPTGVDWQSVISPTAYGSKIATGQQIYEELTEIILRASAMINTECQQVLSTTLDTEQKTTGQAYGAAVIDQWGNLVVHADFNPVLAVQSLQYTPYAQTLQWTAVTLAQIIIQGARQNEIVWPSLLSRYAPPYLVAYTYLNGYPNTLLTAATDAADTVIPVADASGMLPGARLTIYDQGNTEQVQVASSWVPVLGPASVDLAAPMTFAHTPTFRPATAPNQPYDVGVSALPPDVKQACIDLCKMLFEVRGATGLVMRSAGGVSGTAQQRQSKTAVAQDGLPATVCRILQPYKRII